MYVIPPLDAETVTIPACLVHVTVSARHVLATPQVRTLTPFQIIKVSPPLIQCIPTTHLVPPSFDEAPRGRNLFYHSLFIYRSFKQTSDDKHPIPFPQTRISHLYPHLPIIDSISVFPSIRLRSGNTPAALPTRCGSC